MRFKDYFMSFPLCNHIDNYSLTFSSSFPQFKSTAPMFLLHSKIVRRLLRRWWWLLFLFLKYACQPNILCEWNWGPIFNPLGSGTSCKDRRRYLFVASYVVYIDLGTVGIMIKNTMHNSCFNRPYNQVTGNNFPKLITTVRSIWKEG